MPQAQQGQSSDGQNSATNPAKPNDKNENGEDAQGTNKPTEGKTIDELINDINKGKQKVNAYLVMGIDKHGPVINDGDSGQCDSLYLLLVNEKASSYSILQLDRDSITDLNVINDAGQAVTYNDVPLALAHAFGSGGKDSCEYVVSTVSKMLGGVKIDGYIAMNFEGIIEINDAVGGVDVLVEDDMTVVDPLLVKGETVHLEGQTVLNFVRTRQNVSDGLNHSRMSRQRSYINALMSAYRASIKANSGILNEAYKRVEPFIISNLSMNEIVNISAKCASYNGGKIETTKGKGEIVKHKNGNEYYYFYLDQDALKEQVERLFY